MTYWIYCNTSSSDYPQVHVCTNILLLRKICHHCFLISITTIHNTKLTVKTIESTRKTMTRKVVRKILYMLTIMAQHIIIRKVPRGISRMRLLTISHVVKKYHHPHQPPIIFSPPIFPQLPPSHPTLVVQVLVIPHLVRNTHHHNHHRNHLHLKILRRPTSNRVTKRII